LEAQQRAALEQGVSVAAAADVPVLP
jgi:hypothetical protein